MCIIAIKPANKPMFDDNVIETMFFNNPDGAGYMYYDDELGKVVGHKGFMDVKKFLKHIHSKNLYGTNVILHFRIGTSGLKDSLNCHPYPVFDKNKANFVTDVAMCHNGVLHDYIPARGSSSNDTQLFIKYALKGLSSGFLNNRDCRHLIEELIGPYNKLAFLDDKNKVTIIGKFIEDNGYVYSNDSYKRKKSVYSHKKSSSCSTIKPQNVCTNLAYDGPSYDYSTGSSWFDDDFQYDDVNDFWSWYDDKHKQ